MSVDPLSTDPPPAQPELGFLRRRVDPAAAGSSPPGPGVPRSAGPARAAAPTADAADLDLSPIRHGVESPPAQPGLGWLRRRPAQRAAADLERTGNTSLDFSATPVVSTPGGAASRTRQLDLAPLRGRIVLGDDNPKVRIGGEQASSGSLQFTLRWSTIPPDPRAAAAGLRRSTDIHLGCLWEMTDGTAGLIQLYDGGPDNAACQGNTVLRLGGRSETEGQTLVASLGHIGLLKRMLLFAYANNGSPEWEPLSVHLTATMRGGVVIEIPPGPVPFPEHGSSWAKTLVLASLHRVGGTLVLRRENEYLNSQQRVVGEAYGFETLPWIGDRTVSRPRFR